MTTDTEVSEQKILESFANEIVQYVVANHVTSYDADTLPRDESLLDLEVLDSEGVIELVVFLEENWNIEISDDDLTRETMGSVNKAAKLIYIRLRD